MKHSMLIAATLLMLSATAALGEENVDGQRSQLFDFGNYSRPGESSLDGFGIAALGKYRVENWSGLAVGRNPRLGSKVDPGYFLTHNLSFGMNVYSENTTGALTDSTSASLILRPPPGPSRFAPYAFTGSGRQLNLTKEWFTQVGTGTEYHFTPDVGMFMDTRWVMPGEAQNYSIARFGMRFAF